MHICDSLCRDELKQNTQTQTIQNFKWQFIIKNNVLPAWLLGCLLHQLSLVATRRTINPGCTGTPSPQPRTLPSIHWLGTCRYHSQVPDPQTTALWQGQKGAVKVAPVEATSDMPHCELWTFRWLYVTVLATRAKTAHPWLGTARFETIGVVSSKFRWWRCIQFKKHQISCSV